MKIASLLVSSLGGKEIITFHASPELPSTFEK
jgi:hypothetical protein